MRRIAVARIALLAVVLFARLAGAQTEPLVSAVDAVGMTVSDMDRSVAFYRDILGFEPLSDVRLSGPDYERLKAIADLRMRVVRMRLGDEVIELTEFQAPRGRAVPDDSRSNDRWFQHVAIIVSDMDRAYAWLRRHGVEHASSAPQRLPDWNPKAGGIRAFYFKDPDRHVLEILQFPPGKGDAKWQRHSDELFLGIDHTAIVVADTDASLGFYRHTLGFAVAGESENSGIEQEHLNNVPGARLRITTLRTAAGPGIELLQYLAPTDGRPLPDDQRANDLAHWQTRVVAPDVRRAEPLLRAARVELISHGLVELPNDALGYRQAILMRDPDGHAMEVVQP